LISDKENAGALETARKENVPHFFVNPKEFQIKVYLKRKWLDIIKDLIVTWLPGWIYENFKP
jgi:folate-dependent phosphoribosylglycinamide formyltransferase PurN